ncbi:glycosyltransferase [Oleidesulfovibrio sp.]|uniref:glycosyltransferase n=1 Tax=Oleidesulfovibrio sp. TaxID=2909707 RepID=UPI003A843D05
MHLLIPAYNPSPTLPAVVTQIITENIFSGVLVVNDGSSADCNHIFAAIEALPSVTVLYHKQNKGKGAALKTGLRAAQENGETIGVVTADADGQHAVYDIVQTAKALATHRNHLILGVRNFGNNVPLRSKLGNIVTRNLMRFLTGQAVTDTQTGLRGIPAGFIPQLLLSDAKGYEFEMDMLIQSKGRYSIVEVPIQTIYIDGNATSHFNPIMDSMRIYLVMLRFVFSSMLSAVVDNLLFAIVFLFWPNIAGSQIVGRLGSLCLNYILNRNTVFRSNDNVLSSIPKYLALVLFSGVISYLLIRAMHAAGIDVIIAKLIAETFLFFFNFVVQRSFIFKFSAS